jgi:ABC-2 type transport system ATP-binding protein
VRACGYLPGRLHVEDSFTVEALRQTTWRQSRLGLRAPVGRAATGLRRVKNLSKGSKQKLGVVQALIPPELLLLDGQPPARPADAAEVLRLVAKRARPARNTSVLAIWAGAGDQRQSASSARALLVEVAGTKTLMNRSLRRVFIRLKQPVPVEALTALPGVSLLSQGDGQSLTLQVEGEMDSLIKALAAFPVLDFETERPSLEEIFLAYYHNREEG